MAETARTPYERAVLRDARTTFENPFRTPVSALAHLAQNASEREDTRRHRTASHSLARAAARTIAPIREANAIALAAATAGIVALSEVTARSLSPDAVWAAYRRDGHRVRSVGDVASLALWEVDEVVDRLRPRYMACGAMGGALVAQIGATALTLDVPLLAAIALRQIQDHALHYGFDVSAEEERTFAIRVLIASLVPGVRVEDATFDDLGRVGQSLTRAWKRRARRSWFLPFAVHVARRLMRGRSKSRLLTGIVSVGTAVANAWFLAGVADIAQAAYRRRFLARAERRVRLALLTP